MPHVFRAVCSRNGNTLLTANPSFVKNICKLSLTGNRDLQARNPGVDLRMSLSEDLVLEKLQRGRSSNQRDNSGTQTYDVSILEDLYALSGTEVMDRILEHPDPPGLIKALPSEDFFWMVKRVEEDSMQLLKLASLRQWQYLLDLELWEKDRLDMAHSFLWLQRLQRSDPERLAKWLFTDGQALAYLYLFRNVHVEARDEDEAYDLEKGFITLDGLFYIKVLKEEQRETVEGILKTMASEDLLKYHSLLTGLAGMLPAELEEDMYRLRNVRIAEHGFLPREEALLVYAPPDQKFIEQRESPEMVDPVLDEKNLDLAPYTPFHFSKSQNLLTKSASRITDGRLLDRIRLEFAGLCNQILSADGLVIDDIEVLRKTGLKAAGYLNLALEEMSGKDIGAVEELLRKNRLIFLFRMGFGLAQKLKWEAERWLKKSWFDYNGMGYDFWGDDWGNTLAGLMEKRPQYYCGPEGEGEYRDFEQAADLTAIRKILHGLIRLDKMLAQLTVTCPFNKKDDQTYDQTLHSLLFTLWARQMLDLKPSFEAITLKQARRFFDVLRAGDERPPYQMLGFEEVFVKDFMVSASGFEPEDAASLKDTLSLIWQEFCKEYDWVDVDALDPRFSKYILISPTSSFASHN